MARARKLEWIFWNLVVCGFWWLHLTRLPDAWPMLVPLLPLQLGVNVFLVYLFRRSRLAALVALGWISGFAGWLAEVRYDSWGITIVALFPLSRVLWLIWTERKELLFGGHDSWN